MERVAILAAGVLAAAAACDRGSAPEPEAPRAAVFRSLEASRALADSALGAEAWNAREGAAFRLLLDQGIRGTADVSDVYVDRTTRRIASGMDPAVLAALEARVAAVPEDLRRAWREHRRRFRADPAARPVVEGILDRPTRSVKVPLLEETNDLTRAMSALAARMAGLIEREAEVPVTRVRTAGNLWIQDFFVPFDDGTLGVPPRLDPKSFHGSALARLEDLELGGTAFQSSKPTHEPLLHLAEQGFRFEPLRAFVEGGNAIFAVSGDGRLRAIVGRNSVRLTARFYEIDEAAARELLAGDFNLPPGDVVVVPQSDFHIDLYLRAAGPGTVFVASQDAGEAMLRELLRAGPASGRRALEALLRRVERVNDGPLGRTLAGHLEEMRRLLREAGFAIVDYPSLYYSYFATGEFERRGEGYLPTPDARSFIHVNTLNNRYVTTSDGRVLSFALSSGYPRIDRHLAALERRQGVERVFYLGHRLASPRFWGNQVLLSAGGIGCLTNL